MAAGLAGTCNWNLRSPVAAYVASLSVAVTKEWVGKTVASATVERLRDSREARRRASRLTGTSPPRTVRRRKRRRRQVWLET